MNKNDRYYIVTNKIGRRILVVNQLVEIDKEEDIIDEDFDAIYINIAHRAYEENRLIVRWTSPIRTRKCYLKPLFATTSLEEFMHFAAYLIDGFCASPYDDTFAEFIETVYTNIAKYGIRRELNTNLNTNVKSIANMVKFDISRGRTTYTNVTIRGYAKGYTAAFLAWYDNQETLQRDERLKFNVKMTELGFAEEEKMIDRVHTCPDCGESHLLFLECCPKCSSSNIKQESIIHHFRCANISPESTYDWDGQLRCPKCKKILRHIGVDYDRPATIYTCKDCNNNFLNTSMRVLCTNCGSQTTPDKLVPIDVYEYRLTSAGLKAFATDDALYQIESKDIFSGYCTYPEFITTIRSFASMPSYHNHMLAILRYEYTYSGNENWRLMDIMRSIISHLLTIKVASLEGEMFFMAVLPKDIGMREAQRLEALIEQLFVEYATRDQHFKARLLKRYFFDTEKDKAEEIIKTLDERVEEEVGPESY